MTNEAEAIRKYRESDESLAGGVSILDGMRSEFAEMVNRIDEQEKHVVRLARNRELRNHELQAVILGKPPASYPLFGLGCNG